MLSSYPEQAEIVSRVEALFAFADQIEARVKAAQAQVNQLTQSILAKAFRGELAGAESRFDQRRKQRRGFAGPDSSRAGENGETCQRPEKEKRRTGGSGR